MNSIDVILAILILFGVIHGFRKGFFVEAASLLALVLGVFGAIHFSYIAGNYLAAHVDWQERHIHLAAFVITFLVIVIIISLIGRILTRLAEAIALGILNRLLGAILGGLSVMLILGVFFAFLESTGNGLFFFEKATVENSTFYTPLKELGEYVFSWVLEETYGEEGYYIML